MLICNFNASHSSKDMQIKIFPPLFKDFYEKIHLKFILDYPGQSSFLIFYKMDDNHLEVNDQTSYKQCLLNFSKKKFQRIFYSPNDLEASTRPSICRVSLQKASKIIKQEISVVEQVQKEEAKNAIIAKEENKEINEQNEKNEKNEEKARNLEKNEENQENVKKSEKNEEIEKNIEKSKNLEQNRENIFENPQNRIKDPYEHNEDEDDDDESVKTDEDFRIRPEPYPILTLSDRVDVKHSEILDNDKQEILQNSGNSNNFILPSQVISKLYSPKEEKSKQSGMKQENFVENILYDVFEENIDNMVKDIMSSIRKKISFQKKKALEMSEFLLSNQRKFII